MPRWLLFLCLLPAAAAHAGGSFDTDYGIWQSHTGLWHRVSAPGCVSPHSGVACVYYGIDGACDYANGQAQNASLSTTVPVVLTAAAYYISFWLLYDVQSYDPACQDKLLLENSKDGSTWSPVPTIPQDLTTATDPANGSQAAGYASGTGVGGTPVWQYRSFSLGDFVGESLYWRFRYVSSEYGEVAGGTVLCSPPDLLQQYLGFALDDVQLGVPQDPLILGKSVAPFVAAPGSTFTYTLTVTNNETSTATVDIWDTVPAGSGAVSVPGGSLAGSLAQWSVPIGASTASAPARAQVQMLVQVPPGLAPPVDWVNTAAAASSLAQAVVLSSQVLAKVRSSGLSLVKSVAPSQLTSGDVATYSLVLENDTAVTQSALTLTDALPSAFSPAGVFPSLNGSFFWTVPAVSPGQVYSFALWGAVYGQDGQVVVNNAQLSGSGPVVQASASLVVHKATQPTISISAVYPNPAPSHTAGQPQDAFVAYTLSTAMPVTLDIYDVAGEKVRSLAAPGNQGVQQAVWDLNNSYGRRVASGVYVLRLWSPIQAQPQPQAMGTLSVLR